MHEDKISSQGEINATCCEKCHKMKGFRKMLNRSRLQKSSASLLCLFLLQGLTSPLSGQTPTLEKVTTGDIATNTGSSLSSNWGDYNSDGKLDLFIANTGFESNFLYTGTGDSVFNRVTAGDIVNDFNPAQSGTWGDFNNDGHLDIFVPFEIPNNRLYSNKGNGSFTPITTGALVNDGGRSLSAAWGDYDNDGFLDLFVANDQGENDFLYKNNGDGTFTRMTDGPPVNDGADGACAAWADYDNDGDLDLFVGNQNNQNNALFQNNGDGTFAAVTQGPVVNDGKSAQGASWGDYDNDGDLDLFVANGPFEQNSTDLATNALYQNNGDGTFTEITQGPVVTDLTDANGSAWGDTDNDGDLDLFVSTFSDAADNLFYINNGDGTFSKVTNAATSESGFSTGASWGDIDNDGDLDLSVAQHFQSNNLLFVNEGNSNNWISLTLTGILANKMAIGAKVKVYAQIGGEQVGQLQEISSQTGRNGQNSLNAEFGLGDAAVVDSIRIIWPSGVRQLLKNVAINQFLPIEEDVNLENLTFTPTEDSYIKIGEKDLNFGDKETAKIEQGKFVAYLKFQVDGVIDEVLNAKVQLQCADGSDDGGTIFEAENTFRGTNQAWQEETLTADNAPDLIGLPLSALAEVTFGETVEFNVTQAVSNNGLFSFAIRSNSADIVKYFMKEGQTPPKLILQVIANEVNTPPVAENDIASTPVDVPVDIAVTNNDSGIDDGLDLSTLTVVSGPTNGTVAVNNLTGVITYSPNAGYVGGDSFTYTVRDDAGAISNVATVTLTVRPPNVPPLAINDQVATTDETPVQIPVLVNDTDDGQLVPGSVTVVTPPARGTAIVNPISGSVTYTPDPGFLGTDTFTYTVEDNDGAVSNEATVSVSVTKGAELVTLTFQPTDDAQVRSLSPKKNFGTKTTLKVDAEEFSTYLKFNITGLIGNIQSIKLRLRVTDGKVNSSKNGGSVFRVSNDFIGSETPWTETEINFKNAPVTSRPPFASFGAVEQNTWAEADVRSIITGEGIYSFWIDSNSPDLAKYYSKEGPFSPEIVVTTLAIVGNTPPVANDDDIKIRINTAGTFSVLDNDSDPDGQLMPATLTLTSQPAHGAADINPLTGEITYTPNTDYLGADQFAYTVEDNEGAISNRATVSITVLPPNVAPTAVDDFATTVQDRPAQVDVAANDVDTDGHIDSSTVTIVVPPSRGTATVNTATGVITYFPPAGFVGRDSLTYRANDDDGAPSNEARVQITVSKAPEVRMASFRPTDDAQVKATEANTNFGDRPTSKIQQDRFSAYFKFNVNNLEGEVSSAKLRIQVTDFAGDGGPNGGSIYTVSNQFDATNIDWDESQLTFANAPEATGAPLSTLGAVEVNQVVEFDVTPAVSGDGIVSFAILGDSNDEVKYFLKESLFSPVLVVETFVILENQPPVALNDNVNARLNEAATIDVTANDSDPDGAIDPTSVTVVTQPASGIVSPGGAPNLLTYTPNTDFIGTDHFTYRVRDFEGAPSNTATVTITIHPPNLPPVANDDVAATLSVFPVDIDVLANDSDSDGTLITSTLTIVSAPTNGTATVSPATGVITYTPNENFVGLETFTYTVTDDDGATSNAATVTLTVSEAPEVVTLTFGADEDGYVKHNSAQRFGTRSTAKIEKSRYSCFFKFDISSASGQIKRAILRLTVTDGVDDGSNDGGTVFLVSNNFSDSTVPWNEDELSDVNSPPIAGAPVATIAEVSPNQVVEFDVSSVVRQPGIYSFAMTSSSSDQAKYFTHESIAPPQLVVEAFTEPDNTPPFAVDDDTTTGRGQAIRVKVLRNDRDLDGSINLNSIRIASQPAAGAAVVEPSGVIRYTPNAAFLGFDSFTYTVDDNESATSNAARVTVEIVDNSSWSVLDTGVDFSVTAIAAQNNEVYAAGTRATDGSHHLFVWDGASWSEQTSGLDGAINDIALHNGDVYVAGAFTTIGGVNAKRVAMWDGTQWSALGDGLNNTAHAIAIDGSDVYIGGDFTTAGGLSANRVAKWDGSGWSALADGFDNSVAALAVNGGDLFAGGAFQNSGTSSVNHIAKWDGNGWSALANGVNDRVRDITPNGNGIFVAGDFSIAGLANASHVGHWDGTTWAGLAGGVNNTVRSIASSGSVLFAGGDFDKADGKNAFFVAKWDGKDWTPLGTGLDGSGRAVRADGNKVFFGGGFNAAGGLEANHIAQWTETNQPPIAVNDTMNTDIDMTVDVDVLANDIDPNGNIDPASLNIVTQPLNGQISVNNATAVVTYTPGAGFAGKDVFEYTIQDTEGELSNRATAVIFINPPNVPPVAVNDVVSTPQDAAVDLDVTANDSDSDGTIVVGTVTIVTQTSHGTVSLNPATGIVTYTPSAGYIGLDTFTYTVEDNEGAASNMATATIVVTRLQATSLDFRAIEDGAVKHNSTLKFGTRTTAKLAKDKFSVFFKFDVKDLTGEISGATLKLTVSEAPEDGSDDGGTLFQADNNFDGTDTPWNEEALTDPNSPPRISLPLGDAGEVVANQVVEFDVSGVVTQEGVYSFTLISNSVDQAKYFTHESNSPPVLTVETLVAVENKPPVAVDDAANGRLNESVTITVTANDSDPEGALNENSVAVVTQPAHGSLQQGGTPGTLIYTPDNGFLGDDQFTYTVEDQDGIISNLATVRITVHPGNTPPVAANDGAATATGFPVAIEILVNDSDNDGTLNPATVVIVTPPGNGTATVNTTNGVITYVSNAGFLGTDTFTYTVSDNDNAASNVATVTVAVTDPPEVVTLRFQPTDDAQVKVANSPQNFGKKATGKVEKNRFSVYLKFNVEQLPGQIKSAKVKIRVADFDEDGSDDGGAIFPVSNLFKNSDATWDENGIVFQNAPEVTGAPLAAAGTVKKRQNVFFDVTEAVTGEGVYSFAIVNSSNDQAKYWMKEGDFPPELVVETFDFGANTAPVAVDDNAGTRPGQPVTLNVADNDIDPDGSVDKSSVAVTNPPANGSLQTGTTPGELTYTPNNGFTGTDTFTYTVRDDQGALSNEATVTITVSATNLAPVAANDAANTSVSTPVVIGVLANDADSDGSLNPATVSITSPPANGSAAVNTGAGTITYSPNSGFTGVDTFEYTVQDNEGAVSNAATVSVNVSNSAVRTLEFQPTDDGQVKHNSPGRNYGRKSTTKIEANKFTTYFKFSVTGITGDFRAAKIRLQVTDNPQDASRSGGTLFPASNTFSDINSPWNEGSLTFSNAPQTTGPALSSVGNVQTSQIVEFDVTPAIAGDGVYSFCLNSDSGDQAKYFTKEGQTPPRLIIETLDADGNVPPVAGNDQASTAKGANVVIDILQSDTDPDGSLAVSTVTIITPPANGTVAVNPNSGVATYTPDSDFTGSDAFTYTVKDNEGATSNEATVQITVTGGGGSSTLTLNPIHDAQVKLTAPGSNYGAKPTGKVEQDKFNTYLKFNVSGLTGEVRSAKLVLTVGQDERDGSSHGGSIFSVSNNFKNLNSPWTESLLNAGNAPEISGSAFATAGPVAPLQKVEFDVKAAVSGNGIYSFALSSTSKNRAKYYMKEGTFPPELVLVTAGSGGGNTPPVAVDDGFSTRKGLSVVMDVLQNDNDPGGSIVRTSLAVQAQPSNGSVRVNPNSGVVTYTPNTGFVGSDTFTYTVEDDEGATSNAATVTITVNPATEAQRLTFKPVADAFVKAAAPTTNFGAADELRAGSTQSQNGPAGAGVVTYLKFEIIGVEGVVQNATLRLFSDGRQDGSVRLTQVSNNFKDSESAWDETLLVWDNAPELAESPLARATTGAETASFEFDLTGAILTDGVYSFAIQSGSGDQPIFHSKEGSKPPELIIETGVEAGEDTLEVATDTELAAPEVLPKAFSLSPNYPNPFNPETNIRYALPEDARVKLRIYNVRGQLVRTLVDENQEAGFKTVRWFGQNDQGRNVASGIYFMQLEVKEQKFVQRMLLQK